MRNNTTMINTYLAKIGELSLKGGNKKSFEQRLSRNFLNLCNTQNTDHCSGISNIKTRMSLPPSTISAKVMSGRLYVECEDVDTDKVESALSRLIGITSWTMAEVSEKNIEDISFLVMQIAKKAREEGCETFKIECRREDKSFPLNSAQIEREVGGLIHTSGILKTDLHSPHTIITIEIRKKAFVYRLSHKGIQGLPVGSSGKGLLLLSGGIDSPVAGFKMLSRGMRVDFLYFHSHPYTSAEALKKVEDLARILARYEVPAYLNVVSFTKIQDRIKAKAPSSYLTLMMRVCMMKIANVVCESIGAQCIITGESLAQVASQTVENLSVVNRHAHFPVFRPLIGLNKEEIIKEARAIETYPISIIPYDDCCSLFAPKHPVLYAKQHDADEIYERLEVESLLEEAINERSVKKLAWKE